ncbi:protein transport protein S31, partial [Tulasnella sp. 408]
MKLKEIHRTSTFAWSPYPGLPLVASGTVSGALDASFSNDSQLEIWDPNLLDKHSYDIGAEGLQGPQGVLTTSSRFNRLVWGNVTATRPKGVIAAGMENGELSLWDAEKIIENAEASAALIARNTNHTGPVRALDFNSFQTHLLSSGAVNGEIYIWDLNDPSKPYSPGARSAKLEDVTSVAWNSQVAHILASSSNSGFTAVWDLRGKREVVALAYGGGAATAGGPAGGAFATGGRRGMSDVAWHPDNSTNEAEIASENRTPQPEGADLFDQGNFGLQAQQQPTLSLKQPPKWLRRPVSATFGFGGQLISVNNQPSAQGAPQQTGSVHIRKFATEPSIVERAEKLKAAAEGEKLNEFAEQKSQDTQGETALEGWKALTSLFRANSRDELVTLLGFSKESIAANVQEAIKKVKASAAAGSQIATPSAPSTNVIPPEPQEEDVTESKPYEPVVSFAEPEREPEPLSEPTEGPPADADTTISGSGPIEATPSEVSASATSDATKAQEADSTATEPSLFGDDVNIGTPQGDANADFFATIGTVRSALPGHVLVPHHSYAADSSVAATIGSRPSSAASDTLKTTTFKIYPNEESEVDRLLTKSLVLGDFESAVSLCLSVERYADAILLAVKGGPELLQKTQTAYFTKQTTSLPYLRLYQSIVSNDLDDIVQNADLREWQEIF